MEQIKEPIKIYTDEEKNLLLSRRGSKHLKVLVNCSQCKKEYVVQLYRLKTGNLCRKCKISQTKKQFDDKKKKEIKEKTEKTCLEKYGETNVFKNKQIKEKIKSSLQEKYGVENPRFLQLDKNYIPINAQKKSTDVSIPTLDENQLQTQLEMLKSIPVTKWDTWDESNVQTALEKRKQTCLEKYGEEFVSKTSFIKNKLKQTLNSKPVREKYNQTMLQRYGSLHVPSRKYTYQIESFDSSWELAVWIWAKSLKKNIKREPIGLEYVYEGKTHTYYPDFEIEGTLIEVKGPQFFKKDGTMCNPYDHSLDALFETKHQCGLKNGVEFWSNKEMDPVLMYVIEKYGKHFDTLFQDTKLKQI